MMRSNHWGLLIALSASVIGSFGETLIRLGYLREKRGDASVVQIPRSFWLTLLATVSAIETLLLCISLIFSSAASVAPLLGIHTILNLFLSAAWINDILNFHHFAGAAAVVMGCLGSAYTTSGGNSSLSSVEVYSDLYSNTSLTVYCISCLMLITLFSRLSFVTLGERTTIEVVPGMSTFDYKKQKCNTEFDGKKTDTKIMEAESFEITMFGNSCDTIEPKVAEAENFENYNMLNHRTAEKFNNPMDLKRFCFAALTGVFGGNGMILLEILLRTIHVLGLSAFFLWQIILLFIVIAVLFAAHAHCLNRGIEAFQGAKMIPISNGAFITFSCIGSLAFNTDVFTSNRQMLLFLLSISFVSFGLVVTGHADKIREMNELKAIDLYLMSPINMEIETSDDDHNDDEQNEFTLNQNKNNRMVFLSSDAVEPGQSTEQTSSASSPMDISTSSKDDRRTGFHKKYKPRYSILKSFEQEMSDDDLPIEYVMVGRSVSDKYKYTPLDSQNDESIFEEVMDTNLLREA